MKYAVLLIITIIFISGCSTVTPALTLPSQDTSVVSPEGKTRVVFFNNSNPILFGDGSWRIGIKINGEGVENLHLWKYVQVFLVPRTYKLELSHIDFFRFNDEYQLEVGTKPMFIEVFNGLISTNFEVHPDMPADFEITYDAARPEG